jgi:hypothetical protein
MNISDMIFRLEKLRNLYGDLQVLHSHDSVEYVPTVEVVNTMWVQRENFEYEEVPAEKRVLIH